MLEAHIASNNSSNASLKSKHLHENNVFKNRKKSKVPTPQEQVYCSDEEEAPSNKKNKRVIEIDQLIAETQNQVMFPVKIEPGIKRQQDFPLQHQDDNHQEDMMEAPSKEHSKTDSHYEMDHQQSISPSGRKRKKTLKKKITTTIKIAPCNPVLQNEKHEIIDSEHVEKRLTNQFKKKIGREGNQELKIYGQYSQIKSQIPVHLESQFQTFFHQKVNIPYKTFCRQLQKKKERFLTSTEVANAITFEKQRSRLDKNKITHAKLRQEGNDNDKKMEIQGKVSIGISVNLYEEFPDTIPLPRRPPQMRPIDTIQTYSSVNSIRNIDKASQNEKQVFKQKVKPKQKIRLEPFPLKSKDLDADPICSQNHQSIMANIQYVNRQCEKQDKMYRMMNELQEQQRSEREKRSTKKEAVSSVQPSQTSVKQEQYEMMSQKRREETMRSYYSRSHHKNKRLEILNRYHYNPFEETDGDDQCELWKRLMSTQIQKIKNNAKDMKSETFAVQQMERILQGFGSIQNFRGTQMTQITEANFKIPNKYVPPSQLSKLNQEDDVGIYLDLGGGSEMKQEQNISQLDSFPSKSPFEPITKLQVKAETDIYGINVEESEEEESNSVQSIRNQYRNGQNMRNIVESQENRDQFHVSKRLS